ncbi:MAG: hypothetical protein PHF67_02825 [Candidatus Nanoarchaeia archaeon]|nr:hypothetical protein [Candidatus Nanoarchaeia archaeon]
MGNKRGQFYIIAAVIIIAAISGLTAVTTYAITKPEPKVIESLSSELNSEGWRIVDYGILNNVDSTSLLEGFTKEEFAPYFLQKTEDANILFIFGNRSSLYGVRYKEELTGKISVSIGGYSNWFMTNPYSEKINLQVYPSDENIRVNLLNKTYQFDLTDGEEMFYFIIGQEKEGETYVERN